VDDKLAVGGDQHNDLEQVASPVRAKGEPTVGIFAGVFDDERMVDRVLHVVVGDAVFARRLVDLHAA